VEEFRARHARTNAPLRLRFPQSLFLGTQGGHISKWRSSELDMQGPTLPYVCDFLSCFFHRKGSGRGSGSGAGEQGGEWLRSRRAGRGVAQEQESREGSGSGAGEHPSRMGAHPQGWGRAPIKWGLIHRDGGAPPLNGGVPFWKRGSSKVSQ